MKTRSCGSFMMTYHDHNRWSRATPRITKTYVASVEYGSVDFDRHEVRGYLGGI